MNLASKIFFISILTLGILLRVIGEVPPSTNWDEVSLGYNAYSILETGKDEWGRVFPLTFEAFGDYKLPVYIYTLVPFIAVLGLNDFAIRMPSLLSGILSLIFLYLIIKKLTKNDKWALWGMFLLTISPLHIFLSRVALEANLAFGIFLAGFYLFLIGLEKKKVLIIAALFFGLTVFTYNSARVFVPLFLIGLCLIFIRDLLKDKTKLIIPLFIVLALFGAAFSMAIFEDSSSRYYWVSIVDQGAINHLNESRAKSTFPPLITNLIHNRVVYFVTTAFSNYLTHFSPEFLFIKGGSHYQFSLPNQGILYMLELPLVIWGLIAAFKNKKIFFVLMLWLFLAPIPSAITREAPHALRSVFMLGVLQIITSAGVINLIELIRNRKFKVFLQPALIVLFFISLGIFSYRYFYIYPGEYSKAWQYGYKQTYEYLLNTYPMYLKDNSEKKIYISKYYGEPHIFYLYYSKYSPKEYQENPSLVRYSKTNWRWVDKLDNIVFINDWEIIEQLKGQKNIILVTSPGNFPEGADIKHSINFLDGSKAFDVVEF